MVLSQPFEISFQVPRQCAVATLVPGKTRTIYLSSDAHSGAEKSIRVRRPLGSSGASAIKM
jgi:hypothetical protein